METTQDIPERYLLQESYQQEGNKIYSREVALAISSLNRETQYAQGHNDLALRNYLYRIEIEDTVLHGQVPLCKDLAYRLAFRYDWAEIVYPEYKHNAILNKDELKEQMEGMDRIIQGDYPQENSHNVWDYTDDQSPNSPLMQYRHFALLFPDYMLLKGKGERIIRLSEDIPYVFKEKLLLQKQNLSNENIIYQLEGTIIDDENTSLQAFQTHIELDTTTRKVCNATAQIILVNNESIEEEWTFNLMSLNRYYYE